MQKRALRRASWLPEAFCFHFEVPRPSFCRCRWFESTIVDFFSTMFKTESKSELSKMHHACGGGWMAPDQSVCLFSFGHHVFTAGLGAFEGKQERQIKSKLIP